MRHLISIMLLIAACTMQAQNGAWTLRQCIDHALEHNISIKQQEKAVSQGEISLNTAQGARLPNVSAGADQNFSFGRGLTSDNTYTNRNTQSTGVSLGTSVPLYTGGQISRTIEARRLDLNAALNDLEHARENIALAVTSAYFEALFQKELLQAAQGQLALSEKQMHRIDVLFHNGKLAEADLAQAKATVASDQLALTQQTGSLRLALLELSQLLELSTPEGFDIAQPDDTLLTTSNYTPDELFQLSLQKRPQIQAEKMRLQSALKNIDIARSGFYPSLHLNAGMGSNYYKTSGFPADSFGEQFKNNFNRYIGLSLNIPIFNRFDTRNAVRGAKVSAENQQLTLQNAEKNLYKEIQQAYYNAINATDGHAAALAAHEAAQASFQLMQKKFENGKANSTEYEEARTRLLSTKADLLRAKYTALFREKILSFYAGETL